MKNVLAKELEDLIRQLTALNTPLASQAAYAIERMGHGFNWTGRRKRPWKNSEIQFIQQNQGCMGRAEMGRRIGRSVEAINWKFKELNRAKREAKV